MSAALNVAKARGTYLLSDRGSWISLKTEGDLAIMVEGDKWLFNQYDVMLASPQRFPLEEGTRPGFVDWLISNDGQGAIAGYKIDGQQLFFPDAANSALLSAIVR